MPAAAKIDLSAISDDQRDIVAALLREHQEPAGENSDLKGETATLKAIVKRLVAELNHVVQAKKSEELSEDERQLAFEDLGTAVSEVEEQQASRTSSDDAPRRKTSRAGGNRGNLPADLPRIEQIVEPDRLEYPCGCGQMHRIDKDRSERLDIVPGLPRLHRRRHPGAGAGGADRGRLPTEGAIAHVLVSKYADHLPLYRQSQMLVRSGVDIRRSTLADWVGVAGFHLRPVFDRLAEHLKPSTKLFMDETTVPVLDPGRGCTRTGYLWALARDDRPWGGADPPGVAFFYAPGRGGQHAEPFLRGFNGTPQLDGYQGYKCLTQPSRKGGDPIRVADCWAHAGRKLKEVFDRDRSEIAAEGLRRNAEIYKVEADIRGCAPGRGLWRLAAGKTPARLSQVPPRREADLHPRAADLPP